MKVVNIGGGLAIPAECAVRVVRLLHVYFVHSRLDSPENETDEFVTAVLEFVRGAYPGNLRFALLKGFTRRPTFAYEFNTYRRRQLIRECV
jgi:hypothetical protein